MSRKTNIIAGLEIETAFRKSALRNPFMDIEEYHHFKRNFCSKYFFAERDGSLDTGSHSEEYWNTAELISVPFLLEDIQKILADYRKIFKDGLELSQCLEFNDSTGAHIHLSGFIESPEDEIVVSEASRDGSFKFVGKAFDIQQFFNLKLAQNFRELLFKKIESKLGSEFFNAWKKDYFRTYAQKLTASNIKLRDKYLEVNTGYKRRLEIRSFHLRGVRTWKQFNDIYQCLAEAIQESYITHLNKAKTSKKVVLNSKILAEADSELTINESIQLETEGIGGY